MKPRYRVKMGKKRLNERGLIVAVDMPWLYLQPERVPEIVLTIRGNCGVIHTFEEGQKCWACTMPPLPIRSWWGGSTETWMD